MGSWIGVYGDTPSDRTWMRENYQSANTKFKEIHPIYDDGIKRFEHGILIHEDRRGQDAQADYGWNLPCHEDISDHFKQTETDIEAVLRELDSPEGVEVYLSPGTGELHK